jgi:pyrimidine deaminase RibD-like protein
MSADLDAIARLEFGKIVDRISKETRERLTKALAGAPRGGQMEATKLRFYLDQVEAISREWSQVWLDLLETKNGGFITREDVNLIVTRVGEFADAQKHNLKSGPTSVHLASASSEIDVRVEGVKASIRRDLEIRLRRQQAFPKQIVMDNKKENGDVGSDDRKFARLAIDEARKSVSENDGRPHPWVGAVVVKDGKVLSSAHRGEVPGNHAEFTALERNLSDVAVAGATVYATLEPCTTRNRPKIPCADRLIERRVKRVVIGMLDPDDRIRGKGQRKLSNAGIETALFPHDLAMEVEELNRDFTRFCEQSVRTEVGPVNMELWKEVAGLRTEFAEFKQNVEAREKERAEFENFPATFRLSQGVPNNYVGLLRNDSKYKLSVETIQIFRGDADHESPLTEAVKPRPTDDWKIEAGTSKTLYWGPQYEPIGMLKSLVQSSDPNFPNGKVVTIALVLSFNVEGKRVSKKYAQQVLMQGTQITPWGP